ncbi:heme ABC transporter ATP-binding protein [Microvirga subterranea]|uniref:Iron complex transport system ATP-binding protein n=1 Tax=Microvirga subterranea TaxID=186651 RepID=A0A370HUI1_9HYPH|nr:heme ABC transporter ATP-binding protein [Microvirga subterranea]RDI62035.1 iron complex transport system ATP-binding protein [Microvirga subterranea]
MSTILGARQVSFAADRRLLVDKVDLSLEAGTFTVVIGPNGAGKSTLLKLLCGELAPTDGAVLLNGCPVRSIPAWRLAHLRAVMPQASDLGFPFKAVEVAGLGVEGIGRGLSRPDRERLVDEAMADADVAHLAGRNYQTLSGGERQRVHFARVLAQLKAGRSVEARQILFLDEPIASLDLKHQLALLAQARRLAGEGFAVLAVLHDLQLAAGVADTLALMHAGRLVACGAPYQVLTEDRLAEVFGVSLTAPTLPPHPWRLATE